MTNDFKRGDVPMSVENTEPNPEAAAPIPRAPLVPRIPLAPGESAMDRMLKAKRIAVVGLNNDPNRPATRIAEYLVDHGYEVIPVNPHFQELLGVKCYPGLDAIPFQVDAVDVFRRSDVCVEVVRDAINAGAGGVWLQSGIKSEPARKLAEEAGMPFVQDKCLMVEIAIRLAE